MKTHRTTTMRKEGAGRRLLFLMFILLVAGSPRIAGGGQILPGGGREAARDGSGVLMLVREWDPASRSLIGWLPLHCAEIQLELVTTVSAPHFAPDQVVRLIWVPQTILDSGKAQLQVSPSPRTFEGQSWLPLKRDANLVHIGKGLFLVRKLTLGGSIGRGSAKSLATARNVASHEPVP